MQIFVTLLELYHATFIMLHFRYYLVLNILISFVTCSLILESYLNYEFPKLQSIFGHLSLLLSSNFIIMREGGLYDGHALKLVELDLVASHVTNLHKCSMGA